MTAIYILCEDLTVCCPHCSHPQQEININRIYNPLVACESCGEEFELELPRE